MAQGPIPIDRPGLMEAIAHIDTMTIWELVRRAGSASVEELSVRASRSAARVQAQLDRLIAVGLVEQRPAGRARRTVTYRVTTPEIRVSLENIPSEEVDDVVGEWERARIALFENLTQRPAARRSSNTKRGFGMEWAYLGDEDGMRISGLIREIFGMLLAAKDRHARERPDGSPPPPESGLHRYAVLFRLAAITRPVLPEANVVFSRPPKGKTTES